MKRLVLALLAPLALGACEDSGGVPALKYSIAEPWPAAPALPPLGGGRIIVTNSMEDTVSLLDFDSMDSPHWGELARVPVGLNPVELEGPHHAAYSPLGDYYYVGLTMAVAGSGSGPHGSHGSGTADGYALKIDATDNHLVGSVRVNRNPGDVLLSADGHTLYQTHFDLVKIQENKNSTDPRAFDSNLALIDADTMKLRQMVPVCAAPHAVRLSPDQKRAYVACISDEVAVVQLDTGDLTPPVTRLPLPSAGTALAPRYAPYALTLSPKDGSLWVSPANTSTLFYLEPGSLQFLPERSITLSEYGNEDLRRGIPMFGDISADGRTLYMPYQRVDTVALIDLTQTRPVVKGKIPLSPAGCLNVHQLTLTPDGTRALAVCEGDHLGPGTLHVLDLTAGTVLKTVRLGLYPDSVGLLRRLP
jgi:DNA-binding beta-propeller fold protein YncE